MPLNNLRIALITCKEYSDLWDGFVKCYTENNVDSLRLTMVSDEGEYANDDVDFVAIGAGKTYSDRLRYVLDNIDSEYVLLLLEDYYLDKPLSARALENVLEYMGQNNIDYMRIRNNKEIKRDGFSPIDTSQKYCINLGADIWRTECLKRLNIPEGVTPWQVEISLFTPQSLELINSPTRINKSILSYVHIAQKGMVLRSARRFLKKKGIKLTRKTMGLKAHLYYRVAPRIFSVLPKGMQKKLKAHYTKKGHKFYT